MTENGSNPYWRCTYVIPLAVIESGDRWEQEETEKQEEMRKERSTRQDESEAEEGKKHLRSSKNIHG